MESTNTPTPRERRRAAGRPLGGIILILIGTLLLSRELGLDIPRWIFSWPMIPIAVGLYIGARNSFQSGGWMIPIFVGLFFLLNKEIMDYEIRQFFWPAVIIAVGCFMVIWPGYRARRSEATFTPRTNGTNGELMDSFALFGGSKKSIITKTFQGGKVEVFFGGTELDLTQADFQGEVEISFNVAFGGVKIVVPPQWNIRNEITPILGGVDEKRSTVSVSDPSKTLVLKGTVMFGGVDIKSY